MLLMMVYYNELDCYFEYFHGSVAEKAGPADYEIYSLTPGVGNSSSFRKVLFQRAQHFHCFQIVVLDCCISLSVFTKKSDVNEAC
jgi:hypothetical protein